MTTPPHSGQSETDYTSGYRVLPDIFSPELLHLAYVVPFAWVSVCGLMLNTQSQRPLYIPRTPASAPRVCGICAAHAMREEVPQA